MSQSHCVSWLPAQACFTNLPRGQVEQLSHYVSEVWPQAFCTKWLSPHTLHTEHCVSLEPVPSQLADSYSPAAQLEHVLHTVSACLVQGASLNSSEAQLAVHVLQPVFAPGKQGEV